MKNKLLIIFLLLLVFNIAFAQSFPNPWPWKTVPEFIQAIIDYVFKLSMILAPFFIVVGGFFLMTSGGDSSKVDVGKKTITFSVIGLLIVLIAKSLVDLVVNFTK
jgi:hypothetical protein